LSPSGIGFDDLVFAPHARRVLLPAAGSGEIAEVDPDTFAVTRLRAFAATGRGYESGRHDNGVTSIAEGDARFYATDRNSMTVASIDEKTGQKQADSKLSAEPDYVRFTSREVWVTEPGAAQIEVFTPELKHVTTFAVPGGPESLVVDAPHGVAYANLWHGKTVALDLASHSIRETYESGCQKSRGLALDPTWGLLFVGCNEGKVQVVSLAQKKVVATAPAADGIDIIDYDRARHRLFAPGARSGRPPAGATMSVFSVAQNGSLQPLASVPVPRGAHCVVVDDRGRAWVCDPDGGKALICSVP
jgi:streptogramin lyase